MPSIFPESNKERDYTIKKSIVNDTFDSIEVFVNDEATFSYFSLQITNYYDAKVIAHAPDYNFVVTQNAARRSFTFANDLEDSLKYLNGLGSISQDTYKTISNRLKIYNKSASTTETAETAETAEISRRFKP
jgi:hypothetical protein